MLKKITKSLASLRFTIWLISLLALMFLLGLWIPQRQLVKALYFQWKENAPGLVAFLDALQLTDIYASYLMIGLWVLFFLNLALVMWQRVPVIKNKIALTENRLTDPATAAGYPFRQSYPLPAGTDGASVMQALRGKGYALIGEPARFYGVKNRTSPIAFGIFHISFFFILLGGLLCIYTQFIGSLELAEGETFKGELDRYVQRPYPKLPKIGTPPQVSFTVKSVEPQAQGFTETGLKVQLVDREGKTHHLDINQPYIEDSSNFVLKNLGMAPLFVVKDAAGRDVDGAYVKLNVLKGAKDKFSLAGYLFRVTFYPDYVLEDGKPASKSLEFKNPTFIVAVEKDGRQIAEGPIGRNGTLQFEGYRLELPELRYWVRFSVIKELGVPIIFFGFALASISVVWRFIFYRREIAGSVREEGGTPTLVVAARSEYYKSLAAEEFSQLFDSLTQQLGRSET